MLLENVPLLNLSRYLVNADGETESHLHSLLVFLPQWGLLRAHIRRDGPPGLVWGRYMGLPLLLVLVLLQVSLPPPLPRRHPFQKRHDSRWNGTDHSFTLPEELKQACGHHPWWPCQEKEIKLFLSQMWQNTMSYRPSSLCCPISQNLQDRNRCSGRFLDKTLLS